MDIGPDGVSSFSLDALHRRDNKSNREDTVSAIARLYWRGIVASLNSRGQEQLRARLRMCIPFGSFKGFTGEEVTEPTKMSNKTLYDLLGLAVPSLMGLVSNKAVRSWTELGAIRMKV